MLAAKNRFQIHHWNNDKDIEKILMQINKIHKGIFLKTIYGKYMEYHIA